MGLGALTVAEIEQLEERLNGPLWDMRTPRTVLALLTEIYGDDAADIRAADITAALVECEPEGVAARYIAVFGAPPWCWPPDVTRRQRVRELDLILANLPKSR